MLSSTKVFYECSSFSNAPNKSLLSPNLLFPLKYLLGWPILTSTCDKWTVKDLAVWELLKLIRKSRIEPLSIFPWMELAPWLMKKQHAFQILKFSATNLLIEKLHKQLNITFVEHLLPSTRFYMRCAWSLSRAQLCDPKDCSPPGSSVHGDSPGKNTGVGCHILFQGIFPTQWSNPVFPHCRQRLYHWGKKWQPTAVFLLENPRDRGAWWAAICGVTQSQAWLKRLSSSSSFTIRATGEAQEYWSG